MLYNLTELEKYSLMTLIDLRGTKTRGNNYHNGTDNTESDKLCSIFADNKAKVVTQIR